jgi:hypothetical protein
MNGLIDTLSSRHHPIILTANFMGLTPHARLADFNTKENSNGQPTS